MFQRFMLILDLFCMFDFQPRRQVAHQTLQVFNTTWKISKFFIHPCTLPREQGSPVGLRLHDAAITETLVRIPEIDPAQQHAQLLHTDLASGLLRPRPGKLVALQSFLP